MGHGLRLGLGVGFCGCKDGEKDEKQDGLC